MSLPLISVIVPVYNVEKYLNECIDSILSQSFSDFELILVDDGSKDSSSIICDDYAKKDSRVILIHQENAGVSSARNAGIKKACGKYIVFIDSDDWINSDYLERFIKAKDSVSQTDTLLVLSGLLREVDETGKIKVENFNKSGRPIVIQNNEDFKKFFCKVCNDWSYAAYLHSPVNRFYKAKDLKKIQFDISMKGSEDFSFNLDVFDTLDFENQKTTLVLLPVNTYHYRFVKDSATHSAGYTKQLVHDNKIAIERFLKFCVKKEIHTLRVKKRYLHLLYNLLVVYTAYSLSENEPYVYYKRQMQEYKKNFFKFNFFLDLNIKHFIVLILYTSGCFRTLRKIIEIYIR